MMLSSAVVDILLHDASSKVLATTGPSGINAVPVSSIRCIDTMVWLFDYFMQKTRINVRENPFVSLVAWNGLDGYQIKGLIQYHDSGAVFDKAVSWVAQQHPSRTLRGVLLLEPQEVQSISIADRI